MFFRCCSWMLWWHNLYRCCQVCFIIGLSVHLSKTILGEFHWKCGCWSSWPEDESYSFANYLHVFLQVKVRWRWWGRFWWIVRRPLTGRRKRPRNGDARRNAPVPVCSPPPLTVNEGICILNIQIVFHLWKEPDSTFACRMFQSCTGWLVNFWVKVPTLRSKRASTSGPMWNMLLR